MINDDIKNNPLYYEKLSKLLVRFAIPNIISLLVSSLYNIVDQVFIGHGVGIYGNAATNVNFPITIICLSISLFLGLGGTSIFNILLGESKKEEASIIIGNTLSLAIIISIILTTIVLIFNRKIMTLFGATDEVLSYAISYTSVTAIGFLPFIFYTVMSFIIRSDGSPKYSMFCVLVGAIVNTILDPIFIFKWGIIGAGIATIIGQFISFILVIRYKFNNIVLTKNSFILRYKNIFRIFFLGASGGINQLSMMITQIAMNNVFAYYGALSIYGANIPLAVSGIVTKVNTIVISFVIGVVNSAQPIIGFNYGANNYDRVINMMKLTLSTTICIGLIATSIFHLFPRGIVSIFGSGDLLYFEFAEYYIHIFLFFMVVNGVQPVVGSFFTSMGKGIKGAFIATTRQIILLLPLLLILSKLFGLKGALYAGPISDFLTLILALSMFFLEIKRLNKLRFN